MGAKMVESSRDTDVPVEKAGSQTTFRVFSVGKDPRLMNALRAKLGLSRKALNTRFAVAELESALRDMTGG